MKFTKKMKCEIKIKKKMEISSDWIKKYFVRITRFFQTENCNKKIYFM